MQGATQACKGRVWGYLWTISQPAEGEGGQDGRSVVAVSACRSAWADALDSIGVAVVADWIPPRALWIGVWTETFGSGLARRRASREMLGERSFRSNKGDLTSTLGSSFAGLGD